ncbi:MAG: hypothetical protein KBA61_15205 [Spirochaetes bacterium]|nr:hypothetical protein [Spirochaetota bacterium]
MYETAREHLSRMISLLDGEGEKGWAAFFSGALESFDRSDYRECARVILSGSGGAGRLDDLVLGQGKDGNGAFTWKPGYRRTNEEFRELLAALRDFALEARGAASREQSP